MAGRAFSIPAAPLFETVARTRAAETPTHSTAISAELFSRYRALIYEEAGLWLGSTKAGWLAARLHARRQEAGLADLKQYYEAVVRPQQWQERVRLLDAIADPDPRFFREPRPFEFLAQRMVPRWREEAAARLRPKRIRVWSAGCGGGEEPYSLAMLLGHFLPRDQGWEVEVLATDAYGNLLDRAREGSFPSRRAEEIPGPWRQVFTQDAGAAAPGCFRFTPEVRSMVRFEPLNLIEEPYPLSGVFDLIFCRYVLVYLDQAMKRRVAGAVSRYLSPRGFLVAGEDECLESLHPRLKSLLPSIYGETGDQGRLLNDFRSDRGHRG
jgi:chemotaxis protein methyltransferase CheR